MKAAKLLAAWDALEAEGCCECGQSLAEHPALPAPKPWGHGRYARAEYNVRPKQPYRIKAKWAQAGTLPGHPWRD